MAKLPKYFKDSDLVSKEKAAEFKKHIRTPVTGPLDDGSGCPYNRPAGVEGAGGNLFPATCPKGIAKVRDSPLYDPPL